MTDTVTLLRAAADRLHRPVGPDTPALVVPALTGPLAGWLECAAREAVDRPDLGPDPHAVALAAAILKGCPESSTPHARPDAPSERPARPAPGTGQGEVLSGSQAGAQAADQVRAVLDGGERS